VIEISDIPNPQHLATFQEIRNQLIIFHVANPNSAHSITGSGDSKVLIDQSERHPDLSVYLSPPPDVPDVWSLWVPEIVVEVVSKSSAKRDYDDKPAEYFAFGVDEYWIIDSAKQQMTALIRWRGQWKEKIVKPSQKYPTRHLPGFSLDLRRVIAAAK
jgi:Uma2 family endonuclease